MSPPGRRTPKPSRDERNIRVLVPDADAAWRRAEGKGWEVVHVSRHDDDDPPAMTLHLQRPKQRP